MDQLISSEYIFAPQPPPLICVRNITEVDPTMPITAPSSQYFLGFNPTHDHDIDFKKFDYYFDSLSSSRPGSSESRHLITNASDHNCVTKVENGNIKQSKKKKVFDDYHHESGGRRNRRRIRWTEKLHRQFVESVNVLGGPESATPKGILVLMNCEGLTILHIKSHLQKYRTSISSQDPTLQGNWVKSKKNSNSKLNPNPGNEMMIEAITVHIHDVQKKLQDQLKIQKRLQLEMEKQGQHLKMMLLQPLLD